MTALTKTTWTTVLTRIVRDNQNDSMCTLASMLIDIINMSTDPAVDQVFDDYGALMLERQP